MLFNTPHKQNIPYCHMSKIARGTQVSRTFQYFKDSKPLPLTHPRSLKGTSNSTCPCVIPSTLSMKFLKTDFNLCLNSLSACKCVQKSLNFVVYSCQCASLHFQPQTKLLRHFNAIFNFAPCNHRDQKEQIRPNLRPWFNVVLPL